MRASEKAELANIAQVVQSLIDFAEADPSPVSFNSYEVAKLARDRLAALIEQPSPRTGHVQSWVRTQNTCEDARARLRSISYRVCLVAFSERDADGLHAAPDYLCELVRELAADMHSAGDFLVGFADDIETEGKDCVAFFKK